MAGAHRQAAGPGQGIAGTTGRPERLNWPLDSAGDQKGTDHIPRLGIDRDFLWEFGRLQRHVQDKVADVFGEFEHATDTGLHLEKIAGARDPRLRSIRIDQSWRGIVIGDR